MSSIPSPLQKVLSWLAPFAAMLMLTGCLTTQETVGSVEEEKNSNRDPQVCRVWKEVTHANNFDGKQQRGEDTEETSRQVDSLNLARDIYCPRTSSKRAGT